MYLTYFYSVGYTEEETWVSGLQYISSQSLTTFTKFNND